MSQNMIAKRPYVATTAPFDMVEALQSWDPALADCSRPRSGTFMLVPVSTEQKSCLHWSKCGTYYTTSTNGTMGLSEGVLR